MNRGVEFEKCFTVEIVSLHVDSYKSKDRDKDSVNRGYGELSSGSWSQGTGRAHQGRRESRQGWVVRPLTRWTPQAYSLSGASGTEKK